MAKRKLLDIMFPKEFILDQLCLTNNLSFAMQHVFNLSTSTINKIQEDDLFIAMKKLDCMMSHARE